MKFTISTNTMQDLVAKSVKGASFNKMMPITSLMAIQLKNNTLTLLTTDATNYLYVHEGKVNGEDFYAVVQADVFSKLIARLTCDTVSLSCENNTLSVSGNGTYVIELPLDEEGLPIKFPSPLDDIKANDASTIKDAGTINLSSVKLLRGVARASLADTLDNPCYTGYYMGDRVVTTDSYKICCVDIKVFETPVLVSREFMDLAELCNEEYIRVKRGEEVLIFETAGVTVYGSLMDSIKDYAIGAIDELIDQKFESSCKIARSGLLQLLDRLVLFVSPYDKNGIYLTFTKDGLQVESKKASSVELIPYIESTGFKAFTCCADIEMLQSQVKSNVSDAIEVHYGETNALKVTSGNVTQIVALLEDD